MIRKRSFFVLIAFPFLFYNQLIAQANKMEIGIEVSPSFTFLKGSNFIEKMFNGTLGYSGGISFQYNLGSKVALRTNIAMERKGGAGEGDLTDNYGASLDKVTINLNFDYLTMPVLVRYTFGKRIKYFVNAGPYVGYLLSQTWVIKGDNTNITNDQTSSYDRLDAGLSVGTGLQYPINEKLFFSTEIRGNYGLYNVVPGGDIKVNSVNLLLGIAYRL